MTKVEKMLRNSGVTPTPIRLLVFRCLREADLPLSLSDIETLLDTVDKSTISRTLSVFKEHNLLRSFNDGSGSMKYEIYQSENTGDKEDHHVHFRCENCGVTRCLQSVIIPKVVLPDGFQPKEYNYIISGLCPECAKIQG